MLRKRLVMDVTILLCGCLGQRVRALLADHADQADFFVAQVTLTEASRYIADHPPAAES